MMNKKLLIGATLASAAMLSAGFLFPHCGGFSLIALVPLLCIDRIASLRGMRRFMLWPWLTFLLWNAFTTFWVCNATVGGGIAAVVVNSLLMSVIWALFRLSKRRFSGSLPYIFLATMWIAWERQYFGAEVSWPWLTLGNAFAGSTSCVQWYEVTGLLGGSLWVWASNLAVFGLIAMQMEGRWSGATKAARIFAAIGTLLVLTGPLAASWIRYAQLKPSSNEGVVKACALQPNFDPYQKFEKLSQAQQNAVLCCQMDSIMTTLPEGEPFLFVGPETFTGDVVLNDIMNGATVRTFKNHLACYPNVNLLVGAASYEYFFQKQAPSYNARRLQEGQWYESHNSALMLDRTPRIEVYHKSRLVVGTEKMPWPRVMRKLDDRLGGVMGRCTGQREVSLLNFVQEDGCSKPLGCAVCYESIYPEYFASYVKKGALGMAVITNDAWWGDTPGYRQHLRYSCLRAIETRRDIVRSANTGISAFINQRGDIVSETSWWKPAVLRGDLHLSSVKTPFVIHGDVVGRICTFVFLLLLLLLLVGRFTGRK